MFAIMVTAAVTLGAHGTVQVNTAQQAAPSILVGLAMDFVGISPIRTLCLAAILNGIAAPPLLVLVLLLARSKAMLGQHRSGLLSQLLVGVLAVLP
jgi:Mn2+/Fe2+ NRAMP family transporter